MSALFTNRRRVANDLRAPTKPTDTIRRIIVTQPSAGRDFKAVAVVLFVAGLVAGYMLPRPENGKPPTSLQPAVSVVPPQSQEQNVPTVPVAKIGADAPAPLPMMMSDSTDSLEVTGIALPVDAEKAEDASQTSRDEPSISIIADALSDLPVMQDKRLVVQPDSAPKPRTTSPATTDLLARLDDYHRILATDPDNHAALVGQAFVQAKIGEYRAAIETGKRVVELYPWDETGRANLIAALGASSDSSALQDLQRMAAVPPHDAPVQAALAAYWTRRENYAEAIIPMRRALRDAPDNRLYMMQLATLYDRMGDSTRALAMYRRLVRLNEETPILSLPLTALHQRISYLAATCAECE